MAITIKFLFLTAYLCEAIFSSSNTTQTVFHDRLNGWEMRIQVSLIKLDIKQSCKNVKSSILLIIFLFWKYYYTNIFICIMHQVLCLLKWSESRSVMSHSLRLHGLYIVHGILQARILEWVAFPFSKGSSQPRDWTQVCRIVDRFFTSWATRETLCVYYCYF